jgi:hypothetical protein
MKRLLIGSAFVLASSLLGGALSVSAEQEHRSCAGFGAFRSGVAHTEGGLGSIVSGVARDDSGAIAVATAAEHEQYCVD